MLGGIVVLALFALLAWTGLRIAERNTDPWLKIISATLTTWLVAQAAINIGYVIGLAYNAGRHWCPHLTRWHVECCVLCC